MLTDYLFCSQRTREYCAVMSVSPLGDAQFLRCTYCTPSQRGALSSDQYQETLRRVIRILYSYSISTLAQAFFAQQNSKVLPTRSELLRSISEDSRYYIHRPDPPFLNLFQTRSNCVR